MATPKELTEQRLSAVTGRKITLTDKQWAEYQKGAPKPVAKAKPMEKLPDSITSDWTDAHPKTMGWVPPQPGAQPAPTFAHFAPGAGAVTMGPVASTPVQPKPAYSGFEDEGGFVGGANASKGTTKQPDADPAMFAAAPAPERGPVRPEQYAQAFGAEKYGAGPMVPALSDPMTSMRVAAETGKRARNWERWDESQGKWITAFEYAGLNPDRSRPQPAARPTRYAQSVWMPGDAEGTK
jgi:hypothetical protein